MTFLLPPGIKGLKSEASFHKLWVNKFYIYLRPFWLWFVWRVHKLFEVDNIDIRIVSLMLYSNLIQFWLFMSLINSLFLFGRIEFLCTSTNYCIWGKSLQPRWNNAILPEFCFSILVTKYYQKTILCQKKRRINSKFHIINGNLKHQY